MSVRILLFCGSSALNLKVLHCLNSVSNNVHVVTNPDGEAVKYSRHKKNNVEIPWSAIQDNQEENIASIKDYCHEHKIDILLPGDVSASSFIYKYRSELSDFKCFPVMDYDELLNIDNKWTFADSLMKAKIATPPTLLIEDMTFFDKTPKEVVDEKIGFPLIVKPIFGESSHGVLKLDNFEDLKNHVKSGVPYSKPPLIIQSFIEGYDIDASFIADNGKVTSIAVQQWLDEDTLDFKIDEPVEQLAIEIVEHFKYGGPGHIDMRRDTRTGKVYAIEFNPRFWFSIVQAMWQGLNFVDEGIKYSLGHDYKRDGALGRIQSSGSLVKQIIKKPWTYFSLNKKERKALWLPLLDPLPLVMQKVINMRGQQW